MTRKQAVISEIRHREVFPMPYTLPYDARPAEELTRFYGSDAWRARITDYVVNVGGADAGMSGRMGEDTDAYGNRWLVGPEVSMVIEPAIPDPSGIAGYVFPDAAVVYGPERPPAAEAVRAMDAFTTASVGYGVFERAWTLRGMENLLADAAADPDAAKLLFERVTEHQMRILDYLLELPVDGIRFSDDWSDQRGVMIGPDRWRKMLKPCYARLYERAHKAGKFTVQHCCGNLSEILGDAIEIGLDVIQSVQPEAMDVYALKREYGRDITFWGGLGSQSLLPFGTPRLIRLEVKRLVDEMGAGGGYILGPAKAVLDDTPVENFAAVLEAFLEYSGNA